MHKTLLFLSNLKTTRGKRMVSVLAGSLLAAVLAVVVTGNQPVKAQSCQRSETNILIQNLIDLNATTVTNEGPDIQGNNQFKLHFAFVSNPSYGLICHASGGPAPCSGFDGVYPRLDLSGNIISASTNGDCNLKSTITTVGNVNNVVLGYEVKFQLNGVPSEQAFQAGMRTNIPVGQTVSLSSVLL
jgi:hypothetical protein